MDLNLETILVAFITGTAGGAFVQLVTARREGRRLRSAVLGPLYELERLRWEAGTDEQWTTFLKAAHAFQAAALVGGVRQDVAETYLAYARDAYLSIHDTVRAGNFDPDAGPGLEGYRGVATTACARLVGFSVWHPLRSKTGNEKRLKTINDDYDRDSLDPMKSIESNHTIWPRHHVTASK